MRIIGLMTGETILLRGLQLCDRVRIQMAFRAWGAGVFSIQGEGKFVVIEIAAKSIPAIMTIDARVAERNLMPDHKCSSNLGMTFSTTDGVEARHIVGVAVTT